MKIGLVRHFKVQKSTPEKAISPKEFLVWKDEYDIADIEIGETDLRGVDWDVCFSSDLPRAIKTAESIYNGEIIKKAELREFRSNPVFQRNVRLSVSLWEGLARVAWVFRHKSQDESISELKERIKKVVDEVVNNKRNTLIVSHGGVLMFMRKELLSRGFTGPKFRTPTNGKLYVFEDLGLI